MFSCVIKTKYVMLYMINKCIVIKHLYPTCNKNIVGKQTCVINISCFTRKTIAVIKTPISELQQKH